MRGRPTAAAKHMDKAFSDMLKAQMPNKTTRTHAACFYRSAAHYLLESEAASEIPYIDGIFQVKEEHGIPGIKDKGEITEQLGRMIEQDGYSEQDVLEIARRAAAAYHNGFTVKQIKAYILNGRKNGEW